MFWGFSILEMRKEIVKIVTFLDEWFSVCNGKKKREKDDERFVLHIWFIAKFG
jgi:hypothetical protein